jgi:hypothetical protein
MRRPKVAVEQRGLALAPWGPAQQVVDRCVARIVESALRLRRSGTKIVRGDWGVEVHPTKQGRVYRPVAGNCCCALAALIVDRQTQVRYGKGRGGTYEPIRETVARELGVSEANVNALIRGFDLGKSVAIDAWQDAGYALRLQLEEST